MFELLIIRVNAHSYYLATYAGNCQKCITSEIFRTDYLATNDSSQTIMNIDKYLGHERDNRHEILIMAGRLLLKYSKCLAVVAVFCQKLQNVIRQQFVIDYLR